MIDRAGKILLSMIAAGLWANIAISLLQVPTASAQDATSILRSIDSHISALTSGLCLNRKLC
jgi:hypothetical protein